MIITKVIEEIRLLPVSLAKEIIVFENTAGQLDYWVLRATNKISRDMVLAAFIFASRRMIRYRSWLGDLVKGRNRIDELPNARDSLEKSLYEDQEVLVRCISLIPRDGIVVVNVDCSSKGNLGRLHLEEWLERRMVNVERQYLPPTQRLTLSSFELNLTLQQVPVIQASTELIE
ncbi:hypothetical protein ACFE04_009237 [Oxalis oulophora]